MTYLIEKDEGVANQRTLHFRVFLSNGTDPDIGLSNDSVIVARGSATTFTPDVKIVATHAAKGMYSVILSASDVSNLGPHAMYYTQGDFPQHIASFCVVNSNPYSSLSAIAAKTYSGVTFGSLATIVAGDYSSTITFGVSKILAGTYSGVTVGSLATIPAGDYGSSITFGVSTIKAGTYSGVTVGANPVGDKTGYGVTTIAAGTYSGVTVGSLATLVPTDYTSKVTVGVGGFNAGVITTAAYAAAALDATVFATGAEQAFADRLLLRNVAGGADSGRTVGTALYVLRNKVDASSSIGTVFQTDDSTSAWTFSNTTGAFPLQSVDPA